MIDNDSDRIVDDYEVGWIDLEESRSLYRGEQIVSAYVYAVGYDSKYLFVKQHPTFSDSLVKIDQRSTNYFIVERKIDRYLKSPVYGPLTRIQFDSACIVLRINNPKFTHTYPVNF